MLCSSFRSTLQCFHPEILQLPRTVTESCLTTIRNFHFSRPTSTSTYHHLRALSLPCFQSNLNTLRKFPVWEAYKDSQNQRCYQTPRSFFSSSNAKNNNSQINEGEGQLKNTLRKCFPNATNIIVEDISGGCGSMYSIFIEAPEFQGLSTVKQHLLVNQALKQEIQSMHGIRIQTAASKNT